MNKQDPANIVFNVLHVLYCIRYDLQCGATVKVSDVNKLIDELDECLKMLLGEKT